LVYESDTIVTGPSAASSFGIFRYVVGSEPVCQTYRHRSAIIAEFNDKAGANTPELENLSDFHIAAQAGGILASLVGFACAMLLFLAFFVQRLVAWGVWRILLPILLFLAAATQGMTFALLGGDTCSPNCVSTNNGEFCDIATCSFGEGANRSLAATVLYLFMAGGIIFFPRRTTPLFELVADNDSQHIATRTALVDSKKMDIETADDRNDDENLAHIVSRTVVQRTTYPKSTSSAAVTTTSDAVFVRHAASAASGHDRDDDMDHSPAYNHQQDDYMNDQSSSSRRYASNDRSSSSAKLHHSPPLLDNSSGSHLGSPGGTLGGPLVSPKPRKHKSKKRANTPRREEDPDGGVQINRAATEGV
jgi:hypothetical protein